MFPAAMPLLYIKDLKDLRLHCGRMSIDMQVLKDLKRGFHKCVLSKSRAGACPSPCVGLPNVLGGNPLGCACGNLRGPRATVQ